ncbi:MAG TPA: hypothetical protein VFL70_10700 [Bacteroidia bacterium]|nr:hypothetical protein [Bacteroidia bacterium]
MKILLIWPKARHAFVFAFLITLLLASCNSPYDYTKEIVLLDSASAKLKEAEKAILNLDTISLKSSYSFSINTLQSISEKIAHDTLNKTTAVVLNNAFEQTKNLENLFDNKKFLSRALSEGYKRIENLKHDLQNDLIEKKLSDEYIKNEINSSEKLNDLVTTSITKAKIAVIKLDSLKTGITSLADSLASK